MQPRCHDIKAITRAIALRETYKADPEGTKDAIRSEIGQYNFYHPLEAVPGVRTAGESHPFLPLIEGIDKLDLRGKRVLDIGCRDGALSFYAESKGAKEVVALDNDFSSGFVNFFIPFKNSSIKPVEANLYDLDKLDLGLFDVVFFCGVLYHLQFPLWGLKQIRDVLKPGGTLLLESGFIDGLGDFPVMACMSGLTSIYEPSSPSFFNYAGLEHALVMLGFSEFSNIQKNIAGQYGAAATHFPEFARQFGELAKFNHGRIIFDCLKKPSERYKTEYMEFHKSYFEGLHQAHTRNAHWHSSSP